MSLDINDARMTIFADLWRSTLSGVPPANVNELFKEHLILREALEIDENAKFDMHKHFGKKERSEAVRSLPESLERLGINHESVEIRESENGYGLFARKDLEVGDVPIEVPHSATLSLDYGNDKVEIRKMHDCDMMLSSMPNVTLAMIVAECILSKDKKFTPYLNSLPAFYRTPICFNISEVTQLKPSPAFEATLLMFRSIARHYVYFVLRVVKDALFKDKQGGRSSYDFQKSPFNSSKFTFDFYRWCASTVSTRLNNVPSFASDPMKPNPIPTLVPLLDFANYKSYEENNACMLYDGKTHSVQLQIKLPVKAGEEIFLHYGKRANADFLLHNGFVPQRGNPHDVLELKLGFPLNRDCSHKESFLQQNGVNLERGAYHFFLDDSIADNMNLAEIPLFLFAKVFVADDLETINELPQKIKAQKFIIERIQIIRRSYRDPKEPEGDDPLDKFIFIMKTGEVRLLNKFEEKFAALSFEE